MKVRKVKNINSKYYEIYFNNEVVFKTKTKEYFLNNAGSIFTQPEINEVIRILENIEVTNIPDYFQPMCFEWGYILRLSRKLQQATMYIPWEVGNIYSVKGNDKANNVYYYISNVELKFEAVEHERGDLRDLISTRYKPKLKFKPGNKTFYFSYYPEGKNLPDDVRQNLKSASTTNGGRHFVYMNLK